MNRVAAEAGMLSRMFIAQERSGCRRFRKGRYCRKNFRRIFIADFHFVNSLAGAGKRTLFMDYIQLFHQSNWLFDSKVRRAKLFSFFFFWFGVLPRPTLINWSDPTGEMISVEHSELVPCDATIKNAFSKKWIILAQVGNGSIRLMLFITSLSGARENHCSEVEPLGGAASWYNFWFIIVFRAADAAKPSEMEQFWWWGFIIWWWLAEYFPI